MESYSRAYPHLVKLHMLQEIADVAGALSWQPACMHVGASRQCLQPADRSCHLGRLLRVCDLLPCAALCAGGLQRTQGPLERQRSLRWDERLRVTQSSLGSQEPILALRRQLANLSGAEAEAGECWLQLAKLCRGTGHYEAATTAVLEAVSSRVPSAALEHVQLLWDKGQPYRAVSEAQLLARLAQEHKLAAPFAKEADHSRFHAQVGGLGGWAGRVDSWGQLGRQAARQGAPFVSVQRCMVHAACCQLQMMRPAVCPACLPVCLPAGGAAAGAVDG